MSVFDSKNFLEIPLEGDESVKVSALIQLMAEVAARGGARVPMSRFLEILRFNDTVADRIQSQRGDVVIQSPTGPKGELRGTFINRGRSLRETIPPLNRLQPEFTVGALVGGFFQVADHALELTRIQGVTAALRVLAESSKAPLLTYRVRRVFIQPTSVAFF